MANQEMTFNQNITYWKWIGGHFTALGSIFNSFPRVFWFALASLYFTFKYIEGTSPFVSTIGFVVIFLFTSFLWYVFSRLLDKFKK